MFNKKHIYSTVISLGLLLGTSQITVAQTPETKPESPSQFQSIEQPLPLKIGVTLGGLALIGVEMWWFLFSKTKAQQAQTHHGLQELAITVDGGYTPDRIVVQAGKPVRLNFFRKDPSSCLEKVLLPDFHKAADLVLNQTTSLEFTPQQPGSYTFHCGMNMFRGVVEVQGLTDRVMPPSNHNGHVAVPGKPVVKALSAQLHQGIQEMDIKVDKGYEPQRIVVQAGLPVRLNFFRQDPNNCLATVLLPDFEIAVDLPLHQITSVEFTPQYPGEYRFTCGMEMFYGIVEVQSAAFVTTSNNANSYSS